MVGATIHGWTVKEKLGSNLFRIQCKCGSFLVKHSSDLTSDKLSKQCKNCGGIGTHGQSQHPLYSVWHNIFKKCTEPKHVDYKDFGAKGIKICDRWRDVRNFIEDLHPRPEGYALTRIDLAGDFTPENCIWDKFGNVIAHVKEYNKQFKSYKKSGCTAKPHNNLTLRDMVQQKGVIMQVTAKPATQLVQANEVPAQHIYTHPEVNVVVPQFVPQEQYEKPKSVIATLSNSRMDALKKLRQHCEEEEIKYYNKRKAIEEILNAWHDLEGELSKILES